MKGLTIALVCVGFGFVSACSPQAGAISEEELQAQWHSLNLDNSSQMNGVRVNGVRVNGVRVNGVRVNGVRVNGVRVNGVRVNGVQISGTTISGTREDTQISVTAADLNNSDIDSEDEHGGVVPIKVDSVFWSASAGKNMYNLKHYNEDTGQYEWICGTDTSGNPIAAIPLRKSYFLTSGAEAGDPDRFTMSCVNAALGKCVMWGYQVYNQTYPETYSSTTTNRDLALAHQSCQRLVRADYCGDGKSHTANGTPIDVYDTYGIMTPDNLAGNSVEADWKPDGGHCIRHTRWGTADASVTGGLTDIQYIQNNCPTRLAVNDASCANDSASSFHQANGFSLSDQTQRKILRNQSFTH